jgi:hypothetical protein
MKEHWFVCYSPDIHCIIPALCGPVGLLVWANVYNIAQLLVSYSTLLIFIRPRRAHFGFHTGKVTFLTCVVCTLCPLFCLTIVLSQAKC